MLIGKVVCLYMQKLFVNRTIHISIFIFYQNIHTQTDRERERATRLRAYTSANTQTLSGSGVAHHTGATVTTISMAATTTPTPFWEVNDGIYRKETSPLSLLTPYFPAIVPLFRPPRQFGINLCRTHCLFERRVVKRAFNSIKRRWGGSSLANRGAHRQTQTNIDDTETGTHTPRM